MFTRALALLIGLPTLLVAWPSTASADAAPAPVNTPLLVTIDSMTPSALPEQGPIQIQGTVTNQDDVAWEAINLYPFISSAPMTTRLELAEASELPAEEFVGVRITDVDDKVELLEPGASQAFSISVPRSLITPEITGDPGVYWFGVHALGESVNAPREPDAARRSPTVAPAPSCPWYRSRRTERCRPRWCYRCAGSWAASRTVRSPTPRPGRGR